jgi:hypothetical protein
VRTSIDSQSLKCCFHQMVHWSSVGTDQACPTSSVSFRNAWGMLNGCHHGGGTAPQTHGPSTAVKYSSLGQPRADCGSSSQEAHASGWTTVCVGLQEGRHGVGVLFSTVSQARNRGVHYHHGGACGLPPGGQPIDCGMYPAASAPFEHWRAVDFLLVCLGYSSSSARVQEAEYRCLPS